MSAYKRCPWLGDGRYLEILAREKRLLKRVVFLEMSNVERCLLR